VAGVFPAYQSLYEIARSLGCQALPWRFLAGEGGWQLPLDELEASAEAGLRLIVINFPHNPTGYLPTRQELERVVALAERCGAYLFSDEMYRLLELDPARRLPPVCDLYEKGISLSGLSKSFALPGLRLGWLASRDREVIERSLAFKDYTTICSSAPSEILGLAALRAKENILARNLGIIRDNLGACEVFFAAYSDLFAWLPPQAGSIAFPRWLGRGPVESFCQEVLDRRGVMIVPGSIFDFPGHFRVGLGRRNLPEALEQVGAYLERSGL
jgi:aspartate/methionine/tyrosine aminotransferase